MTNAPEYSAIAKLLLRQQQKTLLSDLTSSAPSAPTTIGSLFGTFSPSPPSPSLSSLGRLMSAPIAPRARQPFGLAAELSPSLPMTTSRLPVAPLAEPYRSLGVANALWPDLPASKLPVASVVTKRKGFFSFHFDDIMRVNNVRNAWNINHPDREIGRNFYDRSLWESTKRTNPDGLKKLIRKGMKHSSTVCVMIGSGTWERPWVRYEIARAVADEKGLLAIHINSIPRHNHHRQADALGTNPLAFMGVYTSPSGQFYMYEKRFVPLNAFTSVGEWQWLPFQLYRAAVSLPKYMTAPSPGYVRPLSLVTTVYDYMAERGSHNLGAWIDQAAKQAGH